MIGDLPKAMKPANHSVPLKKATGFLNTEQGLLMNG